MYKTFFKGKKAIIFDMDGTLVQSGDVWNKAYEEVGKSIGVRFIDHDYYEGMYTGDKWEKILTNQDIATQITNEELVNITYQKFLELIEENELELTLGGWAFLEKLKSTDLKLGLASNSNRWLLDKVLEHLELSNFFDVVLGGDEVSKRKPDPAIYNAAAKKLEVRPSQCLVFENAHVGIKSAINAKMDVIAIWDTLYDPWLYPRQVVYFTPDFEGFAEGMDVDVYDRLDARAKLVFEEQKALGKYSQEQIDQIEAYFAKQDNNSGKQKSTLVD